MNRKFIYSTLFILLCVFNNVAAQDVRVAGLENNSEYLNLIRQDAQLKARVDSLGMVARNVRLQMRLSDSDLITDVYRDSLSQIMTSIDQESYQIRKEKLSLIDKINAIEQNYVLSRLDNIKNVATTDTSSSIFNNNYFREAISHEDYSTLMRVHSMERQVRDKAFQYSENYAKVRTLYNNYLLATTAEEANLLYDSLSTAIAANESLEREIADSWSEVYDQKSYVYSYFLEKENRMDILNITENMMLDAQLKSKNESHEYISEAMIDYCLQKSVILNYETYVAKLLNLPTIIDSLSNDTRIHLTLDYHFPSFDVERRSFIKYEPIKFNTKNPYNASNPIPENEVYDYGIVYKILLGKYKYQQNASIFKNISPLAMSQEDGLYCYYAGVFRTKSEADAAVGVLKKKGFKNPQVIEWCNGTKTNITDLGEEGEILYRLKLRGEVLSQRVIMLMHDLSPDCQLSKVGANEYIVGTFDSKAIANYVADEIEEADAELTVEVVALEMNEEEIE